MCHVALFCRFLNLLSPNDRRSANEFWLRLQFVRTSFCFVNKAGRTGRLMNGVSTIKPFRAETPSFSHLVTRVLDERSAGVPKVLLASPKQKP